MRTAITIGVHHGGEITELLEGVSTPIEEQRARFKLARASETHPQFERIELWESDRGRAVHHRFREPKQTEPTSPPPPPPPPPLPSEDGEEETLGDADDSQAPAESPAGDEADEFKAGTEKPKRPKVRR